MAAKTADCVCDGCGKPGQVLAENGNGKWVCAGCCAGKPAGVNHRSSCVVGVNYENHDGTNRQDIIARCKPGEIVRMVHDADNPHDENAVAVVRLNGEQLGFLRREEAEHVIHGSQRGWLYAGVVSKVLRGENRSLYVDLQLVFARKSADKAAVKAYLDAMVAKYRR